MIENIEIWKPIKGFEGLYEISNLGRVKTLPRAKVKGGILKPSTNVWGYLNCILWKNGIHKSFPVHRLVADAFIPNPEGKPIINHIDCNRKNNCVENLEWCSQKENIRHSVNLGHYENVGATRKAVNQFDLEGNFLEVYKSISEAARKSGVYVQNISKCCQGKLKTAGGYVWQYQGGDSFGN